MIKRNYFIHAKIPHNDSSGSYRYEWMHFTRRSWRDESFQALDEVIKEIKDRAKVLGLDPESLEITAFNRC